MASKKCGNYASKWPNTRTPHQGGLGSLFVSLLSAVRGMVGNDLCTNAQIPASFLGEKQTLKGWERQPGVVTPSPEGLRSCRAPVDAPKAQDAAAGPRAGAGPDDDSAHRKDHLRRIAGHNEENFPKQSVLSTTCLPPSAPAPARE